MKETGIMFTPENIRAIREGRKTQTRRVADTFGEGMHNGKKLCEWSLSSGPFFLTEEDFPVWRWRGTEPPQIGDWAQHIQTEVDDYCTFHIRNPYGKVGDRLYIKESIITHASIPQLVGYYMDGCRVTESWEKRRTAMFMPKWAARTWLEITDIRVQRVREISNEDARAEGIPQTSAEATAQGLFDNTKTPGHEWDNRTSAKNFRLLWDSINGKPKYVKGAGFGGIIARCESSNSWDKNPWVWAITFQILESTTKP